MSTPRLSKDELAMATRVLELRRAGATYEIITETLDLRSVAVTRALFERALSAVDPVFSALLEAERLDRLHMAVWPAASRGDLAAIDRVVKLSERREALLAQIAASEDEHALRNAFDESVRSSAEVKSGLDAGLVEVGRKIADRIDVATTSGQGQEVTKALYVAPQLVNVLGELLATPAARHAAGLQAKESSNGRLAQLRAIHAKTAS